MLNDSLSYGITNGFTWNSATAIEGCFGFATGGGTTLWIFIPMCYRSSSGQAAAVTFTKLELSMRKSSGNGGYVGGADHFNALSYLTNVTRQGNQGLMTIVLEKSDGWGMDNNTVCVGRIIASFTQA